MRRAKSRAIQESSMLSLRPCILASRLVTFQTDSKITDVVPCTLMLGDFPNPPAQPLCTQTEKYTHATGRPPKFASVAGEYQILGVLDLKRGARGELRGAKRRRPFSSLIAPHRGITIDLKIGARGDTPPPIFIDDSAPKGHGRYRERALGTQPALLSPSAAMQKGLARGQMRRPSRSFVKRSASSRSLG